MQLRPVGLRSVSISASPLSKRWSGLAIIVVTVSLLALSILAPVPAHAGTCTSYKSYKWIEPSGSDHKWQTPGNWEPAGVPGVGSNCDSVTIPPESKEHTLEPYVKEAPLGGITLRNLTVQSSTINSGGPITVAGHLQWENQSGYGSNAGGIELALTVTGTTTTAGDVAKMIGEEGQNNDGPSNEGSLTLDGPATIEGAGPLWIGDNQPAAQVINNSTLKLEPGAGIVGKECCSSTNTGILTNNGTFEVPGSSSGSALIETVDFTDKGAVSVGAGTTLVRDVGPTVLSTGDRFTGAGVVRFNDSATETVLAEGVEIAKEATLLFTGEGGPDSIVGTGSFDGSGRLSWTGGSVLGKLSVAPSVTTEIAGSDRKVVDGIEGGSLVLEGPTSLSGGEVLVRNEGTLTNKGTLTVSGLLTAAPGSKIVNAAGAMALAGGTLAVESPAVLVSGGTLAGHGTIEGPLLNEALVRPSSTGGLLTVAGDYTQTSTGTLESDIEGTTAGNGFGQLDVSGTATLAGTISVKTGGGFTPAFGDRVQAIVYESEGGEFSTLAGGPQYGVNYQPTETDVVFGTPGGPLPLIAKLSLKKGPAAGGTSVMITGTNFTDATSVKFGSTRVSYTVNSPTSITAITPAGTAGSVLDVTVLTPNGTSMTTTKDHFTYEAPTVTSLSPWWGPKAGGTLVTVTGSGFAIGSGATVFKFGKALGTSANCASTSECTVVAPIATKAGTVDVQATVNKKTSKKVTADHFSYE